MKNFTVTLPDDLYLLMKAAAAQDDRTASSYLRRLVREDARARGLTPADQPATYVKGRAE